MSKVADPRSKKPPPTEEVSISSPITSISGAAGPPAEAGGPEQAARSSLALSVGSTGAVAVADLDARSPLGQERGRRT